MKEVCAECSGTGVEGYVDTSRYCRGCGGEGMVEVKMSEHSCQATPYADLIAQIMDCMEPKNEREWAAKREIERLTADLAEARAEHRRQKELLLLTTMVRDSLTTERDRLATDLAEARAERDRLAAAIINWLDDHRGGEMADANVYAREFRAAMQEKRDE